MHLHIPHPLSPILIPITLFLSFPFPAFAAPATPLHSCTLSALQSAHQSWTALLTTGDLSSYPSLHANTIYTENDVPVALSRALFTQKLHIAANRSYHDTTLCKTFSEHVIVSPPAEIAYIIHTQIYLSPPAHTHTHTEKSSSKKKAPDTITSDFTTTALDVLITTPHDFRFNSTSYLSTAYAQDATWTSIPAPKRDTRATLQAAGDAYFAHLHDRSPFPVGKTCVIVAGGTVTPIRNNTSPDDWCTHRPIEKGHIMQWMERRRYVVDEEHGVLNIFTRFGGLDRLNPNATVPDSHLFRVEDGRIRYIHLIAACISDGCGWNAPGNGTNSAISVATGRRWMRTS